MMQVKLTDLKSQYLSIKSEIDSAIQNVLMDSSFTLGRYVESFEKRFAQMHNSKYCIALNSGTSALHAAMMALNISPEDEVIVPVNTFFATPLSVILVGARPVFVDCDQNYYNIDVNKIERAINKKTKAIVPVHLYGQPANMDRILEISGKHGLLIIEDCAQAHIAEFNGNKVGTFGDIGCFSFYPGKNLGAYGEGGAVLTNNERLYQKIKMIRNIGMNERYHHDIIGHNFRMEGLQGAILNVKLQYIERWTEIRRKNAGLYRQYLKDCKDIILPSENSNVKHVYHLYVIRAHKRNYLMKYLNENGIETGLHYPIPCHLQNACNYLGYKKGDFQISEMLSDEILSLPMSEQLKEEEIKYVSDKIKEFYIKL